MFTEVGEAIKRMKSKESHRTWRRSSWALESRKLIPNTVSGWIALLQRSIWLVRKSDRCNMEKYRLPTGMFKYARMNIFEHIRDRASGIAQYTMLGSSGRVTCPKVEWLPYAQNKMLDNKTKFLSAYPSIFGDHNVTWQYLLLFYTVYQTRTVRDEAQSTTLNYP